METKLIEATQNLAGSGNWGKFCVARFDAEWEQPSIVGQALRAPLLGQCGWGRTDGHVWVMDLQTGEGAFFRHGGSASADLQRHRVWGLPLV